MNTLKTAYTWAKKYEFNEQEIEYATILALKILDDECKMDDKNHRLFMSIYDGIKDKNPTPFNMSVHTIINLSRLHNPLKSDPIYQDAISQLRITMMQNMKKPIMKAYKNLVWNALDS